MSVSSTGAGGETDPLEYVNAHLRELDEEADWEVASGTDIHQKVAGLAGELLQKKGAIEALSAAKLNEKKGFAKLFAGKEAYELAIPLRSGKSIKFKLNATDLKNLQTYIQTSRLIKMTEKKMPEKHGNELYVIKNPIKYYEAFGKIPEGSKVNFFNNVRENIKALKGLIEEDTSKPEDQKILTPEELNIVRNRLMHLKAGYFSGFFAAKGEVMENRNLIYPDPLLYNEAFHDNNASIADLVDQSKDVSSFEQGDYVCYNSEGDWYIAHIVSKNDDGTYNIDRGVENEFAGEGGFGSESIDNVNIDNLKMIKSENVQIPSE